MTIEMFQFEGYTLDVVRGCLRTANREVELRRKSFEVLRHLVENASRLVSKDELIETIWPNVSVSDEALTQCISEVRHAIGDANQTIIKTVPRRGYRFNVPVSRAATESTAAGGHQRLQPLFDGPSIAVLPFANMGSDPEQEYFADGMVEEIITALSRMRGLFVIARNSTFMYKGRPVNVKQVGRELGIRYVLEGSVRKSVNTVRITGQLIDASTGAHIWADRFDGSVDDIFDLQDQVAARVVGAIAPKIEQAEIKRAKRKPTESLDAYDYFLRGMASVHQGTREANFEAMRLLYRAIELDPDFASAYGIAGWCYAWRKWDGFVSDRAQETAEAERLARRAAELGKEDAIALCAAGYTLAFVVHDLNDGGAFIDSALVLNPNLATAWHSSGWMKVFVGETELAIEHLAHAMRLSPFDPLIFRAQGGMAHAHFFAGRYDQASSWAEKAFRERPGYQPAVRIAAASNALAGRLEEAHKAMARLRQLDPELRVSNLHHLMPLRRSEDVFKWKEALRMAGLPE
jgi:TolB-like protein